MRSINKVATALSTLAVVSCVIPATATSASACNKHVSHVKRTVSYRPVVRRSRTLSLAPVTTTTTTKTTRTFSMIQPTVIQPTVVQRQIITPVPQRQVVQFSELVPVQNTIVTPRMVAAPQACETSVIRTMQPQVFSTVVPMAQPMPIMTNPSFVDIGSPAVVRTRKIKVLEVAPLGF